jgi:polyhydroxyalkanoate synthesis regulator phasin
MRRWEMVTRWLERSLLFGLGLLTVTRERVVQFVDKLVEEGEVRAEAVSYTHLTLPTKA